MADLNEFKRLQDSLDDPITVDIVHPKTQLPLGVKVKVVSYQSASVRGKISTIAAKYRQKAKSGGELTQDQEQARAREIAAAAIVGWSGIEANGKPFEYSPANAIVLVSDYPLISEQIDAAAGARDDFFRE